MKKKYIFILVTILLLILSGNTCETNRNIINPNEVNETNEIFDDPEAIFTEMFNTIQIAEINSDCFYYNRGQNEHSGELLKGQVIFILDYYYSMNIDINSDIDIYIEFETIDGNIKGYVKEQYITYFDDIINNLWCKNIRLIKDYYYYESVENIFIKDFSEFSEFHGRETAIRAMRWGFYEHDMHIFERYIHFSLAQFSFLARIISIYIYGNTYTFQLADRRSKEVELAELTLIDNSNSITITHFSIEGNEWLKETIFDTLQISYVPFDEDKSNVLRENILQWTRESSIN